MPDNNRAAQNSSMGHDTSAAAVYVFVSRFMSVLMLTMSIYIYVCNIIIKL